MELREYWSIVRRRWWLPVALTLVTLVASAAIALLGASAYKTEMRLLVSTLPTVDRSSELYYDPIYYANLSAEYLADDLSVLIPSEAFANDVSKELGYGIGPTAIANVTRAKKTHRTIDVTLTTASADEGTRIGEGMARLLNDPTRVGTYLKAMDAYKGQVTIVSSPVTHRGATTAGLATEIGLRTLVGLLIGLALTFLADYLDPNVRGRQDVEREMGLPVLAEVPRHRRGVVA